MAVVFISYARANEAVAKRVASGLRASGLDIWFDEQLPAHRPYSDIIEQKLRSANAVAVLWSREAAQSQWVRAEADFARANAKLVQAQLDDTLPPLPFNQIQCADLRGWRGNRRHRGWKKLADSVASVVAGEAPQATEPSIAAGSGRFDRRHAMAALAALLILVAAAIFFLPRLTDGGNDTPRVAVLPFESVGGSDEALVAGIWEDTRHALSRNPQLLVLGPNTSKEIAKKGSGAARRAADYLVEASVRTAADRVRVSTNLVRSKDGAQIWSQTFDRKLDDVFALQSEIAQQIEGRIRGRLARGGGKLPEHITTSGEVYALYSEARATIRNRRVGQYEQAFGQLEKAVEMDPNFAPGWATLSVAASFGHVPRVPRDERERQAQEPQLRELGTHQARAETYARRAVALAPNLAAGHAALGFALGDGPAAQATLRRAIALDANDVEALNWLANSLNAETQRDEKLKLYSRIVEIEPLWWPAVVNKLNLLLKAGDFTSAERERQRLEGLGSTLMAGMAGVAIENARGDLSEAARVGIRAYSAIPPEEQNILGYELGFVLLRLEYSDEVFANFNVPPAAPYLWRNDPRGLDMIEALGLPAERLFTGDPLTHSASRVYVLSGRGARLAELYRSVASSPAEFEALVKSDSMVGVAPVIAVALKQAGDAAEADRLLAHAETRLKSGTGWGPLEKQVILARIWSVQGRKREALEGLTAAVNAGWIPQPPIIMTDISVDVPLSLLKGEPAFEAARRKILERIAKERVELGPIQLVGQTRSAASASN